MKERKVGEVFEADGIRLKVKKGRCPSWHFYPNSLHCIDYKFRMKVGLCSGEEREDYEDIIFKKVK